MEAQAQSKLIVAGIKYHLDKALALSKTMPVLQMKTAEFLPFEEVQVATVEPADAKLNHGEIVLHKREGKWIIITGRESVRRAVETGAAGFGTRLMSAQALKRCKVDCFVHPDHNKPLPQPQHTYDSSYGQSRPSYPAKPHYPRRTYSEPSEQFRNAPHITEKAPNHSFSGSHAPRDPLQDRARRVVADGGIPAGKMDVIGSGQPRTRERPMSPQFGGRKPGPRNGK